MLNPERHTDAALSEPSLPPISADAPPSRLRAVNGVEASVIQTDVAMAQQATLGGPVAGEGIGLHNGIDVRMVLHPAPAGSGITFRRLDITDGRNPDIRARHDAVSRTTLQTCLANADGVSVGTVEHLMSALAVCGVDNALVELTADEVPAMDGSAEPFAAMIDRAGIAPQETPRRVIEILEPVRVESDDGAYAALLPHDGFVLDVSIDFSDRLAGSGTAVSQRFIADLTDSGLRRDILSARTFAFSKDIDLMRAGGLIKGGSLDNAVVFDADSETVCNEGGLRFPDEFVRHKVLDAIGDLCLAGAPIRGRYESLRAGHSLNSRLLAALFASGGASRSWRWLGEGTGDSWGDSLPG